MAPHGRPAERSRGRSHGGGEERRPARRARRRDRVAGARSRPVALAAARRKTGDWYLGAGGVSPVSDAFAGVEPDSLPPAAAVAVVVGDAAPSWIGAVARLAAPRHAGAGRERPRGSQRAHRDDRRRRPLSLAVSRRRGRSGLAIDDCRRGHVAARQPERATACARDRSVRSPSVAARCNSDGPAPARPSRCRYSCTDRSARGVTRSASTAPATPALALGVGRYRYTLAGGGSGSFAVEPYADELVPAPVTLAEHQGIGAHDRATSLAARTALALRHCDCRLWHRVDVAAQAGCSGSNGKK